MAQRIRHRPERVEPQPAALVDFGVQWYRHGGGSNREIFERFGLGPREYFGQILDALDDVDLPPATERGVRAVARKQLWLAA